MNTAMRSAWRLAFGWARSSDLPRVGMNSAWLLLARVILQAQAVFLTVMAARRLGQVGFGQFSLIASVVFLGNVLTTFGTDTLLVRQVARGNRGYAQGINAALHLQLLLSILVIAGVWLWIAYTPQRSVDFSNACRLYSLSLLPLAFFSIYSAILRGAERMDLVLAVSLVTALCQTVGVWFTLRYGGDLYSLMGLLLGIQILSALLAWGLCSLAAPGFRIQWSLEWRSILIIARAAWPLAALSILGVAYQRLGIFALSLSGSDASTGLFSAIARIVEALKLGHIAILGALLPALSRLHHNPASYHDKEMASRLFHRAVWWLVGLGLVLAVGLTLAARSLVIGFYGVGYSEAIPWLRLLGWVLVPYSLSSTLAVERVAAGKEAQVTLSLAFGLACAAFFNWIWIPAFGLAGACLAAQVGEWIQVGCLCYLKMKS